MIEAFGSIDGIGRIIYKDGGIYEGKVKFGARHGFGRYIHSNGTYFVGEY
jgi:hypothetical protein